MARPTVALCIIAKNEAENLPRLFKSVEGCFDEIHLTDTGSTDNTVEVAKSLGAHVHHFDWIDDFSAARNYSFSHASTDYIAWIDCDDVLDNPEAFIKFRDDVMGLADYWVANYHYALDAEGRSACSFVRERIVKRSRGFQWKYFLHEGILPQQQDGPVKAQFIGTWSIKHLRTDEDLKKDRSRNITIFERQKTKQKLDARMTYYYGKELFENKQPQEAVEQLLLAIADPGLEPHDRTLGLQYLCFSYMALNQFEQAINHAHSGLMIAPNRAEFYIILGDSFVKLGRLADAVPNYEAAKGCIKSQPNGFAGAIFTTEDAYTFYPRNMLARVWANLGDLDKAAEYARDGIIRFNHPESKALLDEIKKNQTIVFDRAKAKDCDDIVITCPFSPYEWDPGVYKEKAMGGSETAAIEMAYWLKKLSGRNVKVFNPRAGYGCFDGVDYIPISSVNQYMSQHKPFLHIAWRHNLKMTDADTFLWCHDLTTPGAENASNYNKIMCLTPFHKRYVQAMQGIPDDKIYVTRNGLNPDKFKDLSHIQKDPWKFVFSSSPDRGLDRCICVLKEVRKIYPQVTLTVAYGIEHLPKYGHQALHDFLKAEFELNKEWLTYVGAIEQRELMKLFTSSAYCIQPSDWVETSCISALERACCGVYQIMRLVGGIANTLGPIQEKGMAVMLDSDCITDDEFQLYIDETINAIREERYKNVSVDASEYSWENVAREWLNDLPRFKNGCS